MYQFSHPLDTGADDHDFSLSIGDTVGFTLSIRIITGTIADTGFPTSNISNASLFGDIVIASSGDGDLARRNAIATDVASAFVPTGFDYP